MGETRDVSSNEHGRSITLPPGRLDAGFIPFKDENGDSCFVFSFRYVAKEESLQRETASTPTPASDDSGGGKDRQETRDSKVKKELIDKIMLWARRYVYTETISDWTIDAPAYREALERILNEQAAREAQTIDKLIHLIWGAYDGEYMQETLKRKIEEIINGN